MALIGADSRRSLPQLPARPFRKTPEGKSPQHGTPGGPKVLLWVDSFSDALAPGVPQDALEVLTAAGCDIQVAGPGACCGLTLISTGQLQRAKATLRATLDRLIPHVRQGRTVVGLEPSCTATLRSDLQQLLPDDPRAAELARSVKTIAEFLSDINWRPPQATGKLLVQPHCHHHSVMGFTKDEQLLASAGYDLEVSPGCCGLAGNFGMEKGHYEISETIAGQGILTRAQAAPDRTILADGFSCRTQVKDLAGLDSQHLVQVLAAALRAERQRK
jgi:Fe-S oxidoreductase